MAVKLHQNCCLSYSSLNSRLSIDQRGYSNSIKNVSDLHYLLRKWGSVRKRYLISHALLCKGDNRLVDYGKPRKTVHVSPFASAGDGVTVDGNPQDSVSAGPEKMRAKHNKSLQDEEFFDGLLRTLHNAGRVFELAIKEHTFSRLSWFSVPWLGIDQNASAKALSYKAAVYCLLQAASEISCRSDYRDKNIGAFVQRSLLRLSAPLEILLREKLLAKQPNAYIWFWSDQVPVVMTAFIKIFEGNARFMATNSLSANMSIVLTSASDPSLLMLALTCIAAITKLGSAKVSCSQCFSMITEITGSLMDMLVDLIPISQAYNSIKDVGLHTEFLVHFGPRAAACRSKVEWGSEEVVFWVNLTQNQLQQAIDKERIWSRLTTSESIEVLEKDLAIFGFFIALGRSTQSFLSANGFDVLDDPIEDFIRHLIGGIILYYPQLSSISSYQFYVEVVCEELDWLPFYSGHSITPKQSHARRSKQEVPPNAEAVLEALDVCSHWIQSFIDYSICLESPSNVKAARFLSIGHNKLMKCMEELWIIKDKTLEGDIKKIVERNRSIVLSNTEELDSFKEVLKSLEVTLFIKFLQTVSTSSGEEQLKSVCSELEKIQKLKEEVEFLQASFRAKADSLQQGVTGGQPQTPAVKGQDYVKGKNVTRRPFRGKRDVGISCRFWRFLECPVTRKPDQESYMEASENHIEHSTSNVDDTYQGSSEIYRIESLRNEIVELQKQVRRSACQSVIDEDMVVVDDGGRYGDNGGGFRTVQVQKKANIIGESFGKLKEIATDIWQGTQLLGIDVAAAIGLVRRALMGDELTNIEKKTLKRTLTDLASVVPIGFLMIIPVTAVGHAAILATIKKYMPALIPSTYTPDRLDLLRHVEKVKEMIAGEKNSDEKLEESKG